MNENVKKYPSYLFLKVKKDENLNARDLFAVTSEMSLRETNP